MYISELKGLNSFDIIEEKLVYDNTQVVVLFKTPNGESYEIHLGRDDIKRFTDVLEQNPVILEPK